VRGLRLAAEDVQADQLAQAGVEQVAGRVLELVEVLGEVGGGAEVEHAGDEALDEAVEVVGGEGGQRLVAPQAVVEGVREERGAGFVRAVGFVGARLFVRGWSVCKYLVTESYSRFLVEFY
jgi:hypothetical protein